jgi:putative spermidine/putrescine transport system permease protein
LAERSGRLIEMALIRDKVSFGNSIAGIDRAWFFVVPVLVLLLFVYVLPLGEVLALSVTEPKLGMDNFVRILTARGPIAVLVTTLKISLISTAITIVAGFVVAWSMAQLGGFAQRLMIIGVIVPLWISVLVRGLSWLILLGDNGPVNTWLLSSGLAAEPFRFVRNEFGVVIGMVHFLLPYGILPMFSVMQGIDQRLLFASRSLGAPGATTFWRVFLPLSLPGVFAASIMVFVFSLGFYVTPALLGGGRVVMMAESISVSILTTARWGLGAAQAVILLITTLTLIGILAKTVGLKKGLG